MPEAATLSGLRRPTSADAAAVTRLYNDYDRANGLAGDDTEEEMLDWWRELELETDAWVEERGGSLAGFAAAEAPREGIAYVDACADPAAADGQELLGGLLALVEKRAAERSAHTAETTVFSTDELGAGVLQQRGFEPARYYVRMRIDLSEPPPPPRWPEGISPTAFEPERDAPRFHAAVEDAFADEWSHRYEPFEEWRRRRLEASSFDPSLWLAARAGEEIAGVLVCDPRRFGLPWVTQLGVRRQWRRRGLGLALLHHALGEFWRRGERSVGLGVDTTSPTGALRLYEHAGMRVDASWTFFRKEVRS